MDLKISIFLLIILYVVDTLSKSVKIVGGENASTFEYPHLVSLRLRKDNKHYCGGSIISNWHILTAAHCVFSKKTTENDIQIYSGCTNLRNATEARYRVDRIYIHPKFTAKKTKLSLYEHDIAIVSVKETIHFNSCQNKINLPSEDIHDQIRGIISGWGLISLHPAAKEPRQLQKLSTLIIDNAQCSHLVPFAIGNGQMCAINALGIGTCKGDSGGGLVNNGKVVGIASFIKPCGTEAPDIYTRVYTYLDFINWIIK